MPNPYGRVTNRIITRGMGPHINRMSTQGFGGPSSFILEAIKRSVRIVRVGQSGTKRRLRELNEVIVWAKMIEVNDRQNDKQIEGLLNVEVKTNIVSAAIEHISSRAKNISESIKVFVKRVK